MSVPRVLTTSRDEPLDESHRKVRVEHAEKAVSLSSENHLVPVVEFTMSRPCRSTDYALVEGRNGAVIRKHMD